MITRAQKDAAYRKLQESRGLVLETYSNGFAYSQRKYKGFNKKYKRWDRKVDLCLDLIGEGRFSKMVDVWMRECEVGRDLTSPNNQKKISSEKWISFLDDCLKSTKAFKAGLLEIGE